AGVRSDFDDLGGLVMPPEGMDEPAVSRMVAAATTVAHALAATEVRQRIGRERSKEREETRVGARRPADSPSQPQPHWRGRLCTRRQPAHLGASPAEA